MRQQKEQTELWLHDIRQQKEQTEQQLHDIRQQKEQTEQQLKEQIDVSDKRLQTITKMQIKNKTLKRELREMVQKADAGHITQTASFMDYNLMNSSVSINSMTMEMRICDGTSIKDNKIQCIVISCSYKLGVMTVHVHMF